MIAKKVNPQEMLNEARQYYWAAKRLNSETPVRDGIEWLPFPSGTCAGFACELYLKTLYQIQTSSNPDRHHKLDEIFEKLNESYKQQILGRLSDGVHFSTKDEAFEFIKKIRNVFVENRYLYEKETVELELGRIHFLMTILDEVAFQEVGQLSGKQVSTGAS